MTEHKTGINEAFLVKRKLKLADLSAGQVPDLTTKLSEIEGVSDVSLKTNPMQLRVSYDASVTDLASLLALLAESEVTPHTGWWTQFKLKWDHQIDQNIKDNSEHQPHCCSKPPPGKWTSQALLDTQKS